MLSKIQTLNKKYDPLLSNEIIGELLLGDTNHLMSITSRKAKFDIIREIYNRKIPGGFQIAYKISETLFGSADANITNLKQKKDCIKQLVYISKELPHPLFPLAQSNSIRWFGHYINTSRQIKKFIINEVKNRGNLQVHDIFSFLCKSEKTLIRLLNDGKIYLIDILPNIINEPLIYGRYSNERYIKLTKLCGKFKTDKYLYLPEVILLPVKFSAYLLIKYEPELNRTMRLSFPFYRLLHFAIIHRRNKVKIYDMPKSSKLIYSVTLLACSSFAGKNLSRLSLYYI